MPRKLWCSPLAHPAWHCTRLHACICLHLCHYLEAIPKSQASELLSIDLPARTVNVTTVQNSEEDVASSLLGTPYLATQASHPRAPVTTPRRLAPTLTYQHNPQVSSHCLPGMLPPAVPARIHAYAYPIPTLLFWQHYVFGINGHREQHLGELHKH